MRIAMVSACPLPAMNGLGGTDAGGQNIHVHALSRELGRRGHRVTVYTRKDRPDLPMRVWTAPGVVVEHVPAGPPRHIGNDELLTHMPAFGRYLAERFGHAPPELVHAHSWMGGLAALEGADALDLPVVQTFHALGVVGRKDHGAGPSPVERIRLEQSIAERAAAVISTNGAERAELARRGLDIDRIHVIPCGVETGRFHPHGRRYPRGNMSRLLHLGRLVERDGIDTLIRALADIPDTELIVAGGPPRDRLDGDPDVRRLRAVAARAGVGDRVRFLGRVPHARVPALMRSADVVVSVPWYEPFGIVAAEAMACGVPVATAPVGGHLDSVIDGITGIHVPERDPAEIARRLRALLADPPRRHALGAAAAFWARTRFSWERVATQTVEAYQHTLKATTARIPAGVL
jgi:glycosyltransferase involved in cell wall biosynthesis